GPTALVEAESRFKKTSFPDRSISVDQRRGRASFTYSEPWTVPAWTLNVLAPPSGYYAESLVAEFLDDSGVLRFRPAADEGRLFYFALFQGHAQDIAFETHGRFVRDEAKVQRELERGERGGPSRWGGLWAAAAEPLSVAGQVLGAAA